MQFLLDNLTATIVSGVLILSLQFTQVRSKHAAVEQIVAHSTKKRTLDFGEWVQDDILNIGANFGEYHYRFEDPIVDPVTGDTREWEFYSDSTFVYAKLDASGDPVLDLNGDPDVLRVPKRLYKRYRLTESKQAAFRDTTYQLYELHRDTASVHLDANKNPTTMPDWGPTWASTPTLSFFRVDLLDRLAKTPRDAAGAIVVEEVDYVRVRFGIIPDYVLASEDYLRELYWVKTLKVRPYWTPLSYSGA